MYDHDGLRTHLRVICQINRENNVYGSSFQHVADKVQHVGKHHADASFDVVSIAALHLGLKPMENSMTTSTTCCVVQRSS